MEHLAAWASECEHAGDLDPADADLLAEILSAVRDAADPHRFRREEPDDAALLARPENDQP